MKTINLNKRQRGFVLNAEYMLFVIILVLGLVVGWVSLRDSLNAELMDTANAIEGSIKFYYFNDPDRGLGPAFINDELEFCPPGSQEGVGSVDPDGVNCQSTGTTPPVQ